MTEDHLTASRGNATPVVLNVMGCRSIQYGSFEDYLVAATRSCHARGMTPVFVYPQEPVEPMFRTEIEKAGGRILIIPGTETAGIGGSFRLWREMRALDPVVVHAHFGRVGYTAAVLGRVVRAPAVVLSKHQTSWPYITSKSRLVYRVLSRLVSVVLVGAPPVLEELPSLGVPAEKSRLVLFPGIDTSRYRTRPGVRERIRLELGIPEDVAMVVAVSHLKVQKGVRFLIEAIPRVLDKYPDTVLVVVGDGAQRAELEALADSCRLGDRIRFLGHRSDVPEVLAAADVFACPSLCEGGCAGSLEAMAVGMPIVSTPVGIARDLVGSSGAGVIVASESSNALAEGLSTILASREHWGEMGQRAREIVESAANVHLVAEQLAEMYSDLAGSKHPAT